MLSCMLAIIKKELPKMGVTSSYSRVGIDFLQEFVI